MNRLLHVSVIPLNMKVIYAGKLFYNHRFTSIHCFIGNIVRKIMNRTASESVFLPSRRSNHLLCEDKSLVWKYEDTGIKKKSDP
jgi:hypothetical protein